MRQPHIGSHVLYQMESGMQFPAVVIRPHIEDMADVRLDILVFGVRADLPALQYVNDVPQGNNPGEWQWQDIPIG